MHRDYPELKNGRKELTYLHPDIEPILKDTYGLMLYQESVMRVAQKFAGYSLEEADNLRKACGKKIRAMIAAEREKFVAGCITEGYGEELGTQLFDIIEPFADYAFNKSHSYGYGLVAYQTAWLKAHYPVEYMSALLTSVKDNKDKTAVYLAECRSMGIDVLVPDVNRSLAEFAPDITVDEDGSRRPEQAIVFGLAAVRNVGESLVERIVAERNANGPFEDIFDFCARVDPVVLNKRTMESLVKGERSTRSATRARVCASSSSPSSTARSSAARSRTWASRPSSPPSRTSRPTRAGAGPRWPSPTPSSTRRQRLAFEKEMLGLYVSDHPLMGYEAAMARHTDCTLSDMREDDTAAGDRAPVRSVGGVVTDLRRSYTKKGDLMARFVLEDLQAAMEVFVFPKTMAEYGALIENDAILVVRGRLDTREEEPKIVCMEVSRPILERGQEDLHITLPLGVLTDAKVDGLKDVLSGHPGHVAGAAPRRRQGPAPAAGVQRGLPQRPGGRAQAAARAERRPLLRSDAGVRNRPLNWGDEGSRGAARHPGGRAGWERVERNQ